MFEKEAEESIRAEGNDTEDQRRWVCILGRGVQVRGVQLLS